MAYTKNTWATGDIITADKLNNLESGLEFATAREQLLNGYDLNGYTDTYKYVINGANLVNYPSSASVWATLDVEKINQNTSTQTLVDANNNVFIRNLGDNPPIWSAWTEIANDSKVVHNTGTGTVAGDKTFTGNNNFSGATTLQTGNYGLRVTTSGVQKTSDGGTTWINI